MGITTKYKIGECPNCKNKGFRPHPKEKSPIKIYKTETYGKTKIRYCVCRLCDFQFKISIKEEFVGPVDTNYNKSRK